jgi:hypothetical protein
MYLPQVIEEELQVLEFENLNVCSLTTDNQRGLNRPMTPYHCPHHHGQCQDVFDLSLVPSPVTTLVPLFKQHRFPCPPPEQPCCRILSDPTRPLHHLAQILRDLWTPGTLSSSESHWNCGTVSGRRF